MSVQEEPEVGLLHCQFLPLLWKLEGGPHLPGKLSVIFHSWYCQQLGLPVQGFTLLSCPWYPWTKLQDQGLWRHHITFISRGLQQPSQEWHHLWPEFWWLLQFRAFASGSFFPGPCFWVSWAVGGRGSSNCTWQHLIFCSSLLCPWWSLLLDLPLGSEQFWVQLNLSISSLRVAAVASAFRWASQTVARLLSTELSFFPFWSMPLLEEWGSSGWGLTMAAGAFSPFHPWWSLREDSTSSRSAGSPGGNLGSLHNL